MKSGEVKCMGESKDFTFTLLLPVGAIGFTLLLVYLVHFHFTFTLLLGVFIFLFSLLLPMRGRRGKEEEEELKQKIRSLLEEGKTYEEIEEETGASQRTIAKIKKQMEREEVGHRSPLESKPPTEDQEEIVEEGGIDEEEAARQLEAIDKATGSTALNEVIAKVEGKKRSLKSTTFTSSAWSSGTCFKAKRGKSTIRRLRNRVYP